MYLKTAICLLAASVLAAASEVNFYYDDNCQTYANSVTLQDNFASSGGANGAHSAMFISVPEGLGWWSILTEGEERTLCPRVWSASEGGQCVAYSTGVFANVGTQAGWDDGPGVNPNVCW